MSDRLSPWGVLIAVWGVGGVILVLAQALWRLTPYALEPIVSGMLGPAELALYLAWILFNAYAEGYRGFQRAFSPRVVARAFHLARHPKPLHVLLAPVYCMALFHASRRRLVAAWVLVALIVAVVAFVRRLPQPWRGIIDGGVVIGLLWGALSIVILFAIALLRNEVPPDDSLPDAVLRT
jgi:hypothetical protein